MSFNRLASLASGDKKRNQRSENQANTSMISNTNPNKARRPFGALDTSNNLPRPVSTLSKKPSGNTHGIKAIKVLGDLTRDPNISVSVSLNESAEKSKESTNVKDRMREWEREKERLREMERLEEMEKERDEMYKREKEKQKKERREREKKLREEKENGGSDVNKNKHSNLKKAEKQRSVSGEEQRDETEEDALLKERKNASVLQIKIPPPKTSNVKVSSSQGNNKSSTGHNVNKDWDWDKENIGSSATSPVLPMFKPTSPLTQGLCPLYCFRDSFLTGVNFPDDAVLNMVANTDTPPPSTFARKEKETKQSIFKHSIKASIGELSCLNDCILFLFLPFFCHYKT